MKTRFSHHCWLHCQTDHVRRRWRIRRPLFRTHSSCQNWQALANYPTIQPCSVESTAQLARCADSNAKRTFNPIDRLLRVMLQGHITCQVACYWGANTPLSTSSGTDNWSTPARTRAWCCMQRWLIPCKPHRPNADWRRSSIPFFSTRRKNRSNLPTAR